MHNSYHDAMCSVVFHLLYFLRIKYFRHKVKGEFSTFLVLRILHRLRIIINHIRSWLIKRFGTMLISTKTKSKKVHLKYYERPLHFFLNHISPL